MWLFGVLFYPFASVDLKNKVDCIINSNLTILESSAVLKLTHACDFDHGVEITLITASRDYTKVVRGFGRQTQQIEFSNALSRTESFVRVMIQDVGQYAEQAISKVFYSGVDWNTCLSFGGVTVQRELCFQYALCTPAQVVYFAIELFVGSERLLWRENANSSACFVLDDQFVAALVQSPLVCRLSLTALPQGETNYVSMQRMVDFSHFLPKTLDDVTFLLEHGTATLFFGLSQAQLAVFSGYQPQLRVFSVEGANITLLNVQPFEPASHFSIQFGCEQCTKGGGSFYFVELFAHNGQQFIWMLSSPFREYISCWEGYFEISDKLHIVSLRQNNNSAFCSAINITGRLLLYSNENVLLLERNIELLESGYFVQQSGPSAIKFNNYPWIIVEIQRTAGELYEAIIVRRFILSGYRRYLVISSATLAALAVCTSTFVILYFRKRLRAAS